MSGNFTQYSLIWCAIAMPGVGSTVLTEEAKVSFKRAGGGKLVETVLKKFAGISPGAPMVTGTISNMIPASGLEVDLGPLIVAYTPVAISMIRTDGKGLNFQAIFLDDDTSHSVGASADYTINFAGYFDPASWS